MKEKTIPVLFFVTLGASLFLGDGKQPVIDIFGSAALLVLWFVHLKKSAHAARPLPKTIIFAWLGVVAATIVSMIFSDSLGLSLSWIVRLACGYLAYRLFYDLTEKRSLIGFVYGSLALTVVASILALISFMFPAFVSILPSMNLVSLTFGHNHLADMLVFIAPAVWIFAQSKFRRSAWVPVALYVLALLLTLARGAWILVSMYALYECVRMVRLRERGRGALLAVCLLVCLCAGFIFYVDRAPKAIPFLKKTEAVSVRLEYWRQAVTNIREHPLVGSGPGTFSLVSNRLQNSSGQISWFAHSELLQITSDLGLLGLIAFVWLGASCWAALAQVRGETEIKYSRALMLGVVLIFIYSLFEFVLDYFIMWLLFWAALGVLTGLERPNDQKTNRVDTGVVLAAGLIGIYYILWVIAATAGLMGLYKISFYVAPFDSVNALGYLERAGSDATEPRNIKLILFFHRNNPEIRFRYATLLAQQHKTPEALEAYAYAIALAPQNPGHRLEYIQFLYGNNLLEQLSKELAARGDVGLNEGWKPRLYKIGLDYVHQGRFQSAVVFWKIATQVSPATSYMWIEYASLLNKLGRTDQALWALRRCEQDPFASAHCRESETYFIHQEAPPLGYYENIIL